MSVITKKLKRSIVMLLVCALFAGSIPMNTYAAFDDGHKVTVQADDGATVEVTGVSVNALEDGSYHVVSANQGVDITVTEDKGYDVTYVGYTVSDNGTEKELGKIAGTYNINYIEADTDIIVKTVKEKYDVAVSANNATVKFGDADSKKTVEYGEDLAFTVTPDENYEVTSVTYTMGTGKETTLTAEAGTYTIKDVEADVKITVTAEVKTYSVSVSANNAEVTVSENAVAGEALKFTVEVEDNYEVTEVKYVMGDKTEELEARTGEFTIAKVTADVTIYATAEEVKEEVKTYSVSVSANNAEVTAPEKVTAGEALKFTVEVEDNYVVTEVKYVMGDKTEKLEARTGEFTITEVTADVTIYVTAEEVVEEVVESNIKSVKVDKVDNKGNLKQTAYTEKEYKVTFKTTDGKAPTEVTVKATGNVEARMENGKLAIIAGGKGDVSENTVTILDSEGNVVEGGKIKVAIQDPKFVAKAPTVKAKSSTNASITLTLSSKGLVEKSGVPVFYEVTLVTDDKDVPESLRTLTKPVLRTADSQDVKIELGFEEGSIDKVIEYKVSAKLVQGEYAEKNAVSKTVVAKTNKPAYETKLKLKKGTTKIYAGQSDVEVATAVFSKTTSYKSVSVNEFDSKYITARYDWKTEKIYVSVDRLAPAGKYTLVATSEVGNTDMKASTATLTFTVVGGIDEIEVDAPVSIYKKEGRKANFNVTYDAWDKASYGDEKHAFWMYLKKSNVKYSVVDVDGDTDTELSKYITVNNKGKVTIDSKFDVSGNNGFKIKVEANDYPGNDCWAVSDVITVTDQAVKVGAVVLVNENNEIVAQNGFEGSIDEIRGTYVRALKDGVTVSGNVSDNDFIDARELTLKVSNKNFVLDGNEVVGLNKAVKNLTITATRRDGSGQKNILKLTSVVGYVGDIDLEAQYKNVSDNWEEFTVSGSNGKYTGTYYGVQRTPLTIDLVDEDGDNLYNRAAGFKVTIKDANVYVKDNANGRFVLEPKKPSVSVKLSYKNASGTKVEKEYKLVNGSLIDATAISGKVKVNGNFVENAWSTVKVTIPGENVNGKYVTITPDQVKYNNLKDSKYRNFAGQLYGQTYEIVDNTIEVEAWGFNKGSYKMYVTVGTKDAEGNFIPETTDKDVTFKVVAFTKAKLATSYTLYLADGDSVALKSTSKTPIYEIGGVYNVNVKGQPNDFLKNFTVDRENVKLVYTGDLVAKDFAGIVDYWDGTELKSAQIKIKVKLGSANKLSAPNVKVLAGTDVEVPVTKKNVEDFSIFAVDGKVANSGSVEKSVDGKMIVISGNDLATKGTKKVDAKVVGDDAYELIKVAAVSSNDNIKAYGQQVKFNVSVVDEAAAKKASKVKASNVTFTEDDYNSKFDTYVVVGEYSELIAGVNAVSANSTNAYGVKVALVDGTLTYEVDKDTLNTLNLFGKTKTIKVKFNFGEFGEEQKSVKITFPKESTEKELNLNVVGNASVSVNGTTVSDNGVIKVYANEFSFEVVEDAGYEVVDVTVSANDVELEVAEWDGFYTVDVKEVADGDTVTIDVATKEVEVDEPSEPEEPEDPVGPDKPEVPTEQFSVSFNCVSANAVTVTLADGTTVSANGASVSVSANETLSFSVSANEGFEVLSVSVNGVSANSVSENGVDVYKIKVEKDTTVTIVVVAKAEDNNEVEAAYAVAGTNEVVEEVVTNSFFNFIANKLKSLFFWS